MLWYHTKANEEEVSASHLVLRLGSRVDTDFICDIRRRRFVQILLAAEYFISCCYFFTHWRCGVIGKNDLLVNEEITAKEVRLIDEEGNAVGIMSAQEALRMAYSKELDLVNIAPTAVPPVCKIMDYGKYVFDMAKKEKEARKNQKVVDIKEVRLSLGIGDHDFMVKVKNALKFLKDGDKVKLTVKFVGREMNFTKAGEELIDRFAENVSELGIMDKKPKLEGRRMTVMFNPK